MCSSIKGTASAVTGPKPLPGHSWDDDLLKVDDYCYTDEVEYLCNRYLVEDHTEDDEEAYRRDLKAKKGVFQLANIQGAIGYGFTCRHCLQSGFTWEQDAAGDWRMFSIVNGKPQKHMCIKKEKEKQ